MSLQESLTAAGKLVFDETAHRYWLNGRELPGITSRLKVVGYLDERVYRPGSAERGTAVHLATQFADEGDLAEDSVAPQIRGYVRGWQSFLTETCFVRTEPPELLVCSPTLGYATKIDRIGILNGKTVVINIKTSASPEVWWPLQLAGEALAYSEWLGVPLHRLNRMDVRLRPDGDFAIDTHSDRHDYDDFRALVRLAARMERDGIVPRRKAQSHEQSEAGVAA